MAELRVNFHQHLATIESQVLQLFAMVGEDLAGATHALLSGDTEVLATITDRELLIDVLREQMETEVVQELARQAPAVSDLRFLLSVLRIVPELERSHDLVLHIARHATHILGHDLTPRSRGLVQRMGEIGVGMWRQTMDAWHHRDASAAARIDEDDDELDGLHTAFIAELAAGRMALPVTMDMTLVGRFYERLGDHAVNISRRVTYLAGFQIPA